MSSDQERTGAQILVDQLLIHQVDTIFGVPGESFIDVLDSLYDESDRIRFIVTRIESSAANMADAYGKLTGRPGICMVARGPGACHASIGLHTAAHDGTPLVLFVGQVPRSVRGRGAFQELDFERTFADIAKWTVELDDPGRIPELIARAFCVAVSGQPGPVVISMPEDVLAKSAITADAPRYKAVRPAPSASDLKTFSRFLSQAERPLLIVGGGPWTGETSALLRDFSIRHHIPVAAAFRAQDMLDNDCPSYAGDLGLGQNPQLSRMVRDADLVIAVGTRLEEAVTRGYTLLEVPAPRCKLVHVHPDSAELGKVYQADLPVNSDVDNFFAALADLAPGRSKRREDWCSAARETYLRFQDLPPPVGNVDLGQVMKTLREKLPDDAIVTNGAGNYSIWLHRFFRYRNPKTQLAPTSGAMGYGVPAANAAKLVAPERTVVSLSGDGCFMMCSQELATAVQYGLKVIFIVVNNSMLGSIRMHQERKYPNRVIGTTIDSPDFVALAKAHHLEAQRVSNTGQFAGAMDRALLADRPCLIEIVLDPQAMTPSQDLASIRKTALEFSRG